MERHVKVFRNGRNRAVRIPVEFDFPGDEVLMHKEGNRIIIEPVKAKEGLREWLSKQQPIDDEFPDVDAGLLPARDVDL